MRQLHKVGLFLAALTILASCTEDNPANFNMEKPQSIVLQDSIDNGYDLLKSYIGSDANFTLGAGVSLSAYNEQGVIYRLVNSNFQEITAGYGMKHGAVVQADGSLALEGVNNFLAAAEEAGISVYGHTLAWHANQNAEYLNSTIAPTVVESDGPTWDLVSGADFETDDASNYESNTNAITSFTADGEGANGEGRALQIINEEVRANEWDSQFFVTFNPHMEVGEKYRLTMDVRADDQATFATQAHNEPYQYIYWDFFGSITATTEWSTFSAEITVSENTAGTGTVAFNLGNTATTYYFDNIEIRKYNEDGGKQYEEKTPEEKKQILSDELERWISGMMSSASYVDAWDVVNEPITDGNPMAGEQGFQLKTAGESPPSDHFFWQDYIGEDYGVQAFQLAREYGDENDLLFINDYNLEYNLDKCRALINYMEYIEDNGATVDGIGTQMHLSINSDKENIAEMFSLLAETGKLVKVSELDIGLGGVTTENATAELYEQQSEMYKYVVEKYFEIIPEEQRYGITVWSPLDSPQGSSWRAGEPIGLWTLEYERKRAYAGFAVGLMNALGSDN
ncbi:endo-1,4-beta-xylanase [Aliifodinibius sp. S!AR15-10]|uniref:endo-1,4-beta-xylanase n=1 Tax=Aliifodinibius sp. S!AR15-10 TaxID=2950437 RepID=UPI002859C72C|nr:endo-1,4-beta-xylanase [Aliifodinibius sp. S!AR15-10]MDR8393358.1 endo-1,4-beta-xylanase [Aliifodinibius sp. S!AR15-10]